MKRVLRACALIAAIAAPAMLSAQTTDQPVSFGVSGGLSLPMGDLGDVAKSGFNITGHVHFTPASLTSVRLRGDVAYDRWDVDGFDASTRSIAFAANAVYDFPAQSTSIVRPYVLGGLGLFSLKTSATSGAFTNRSGDTNLGLQVGGGLTFQLSGFSTFAEAKLVSVFTDGQSTRYIPVTFGVRF